MIEKAEKVLDLAAEALLLYIRKTTAELGEALPITTDAQPKARKPRAPKAPAAPAPAEEAPAAGSPFGIAEAPVAALAGASVEDKLEARRRYEEVAGLFIRRYLNAQPPGLARLKALLQKEIGRLPKLDEMTYAEHVKLVPVIEAELEKAAA